MIFSDTKLKGVFVVDLEPIDDERGFFARTFCQEEFTQKGLVSSFDQTSVSFNKAAGTLRGMHYQAAPFEETKLVRCTMGRVYDVTLDLRRDSPTFLSWVGVELSAGNRSAIYIPRGCAHGFLTLADDCEILYDITPAYHGQSARGVRWNDPIFGIQWPIDVKVISDRDRAFPDFCA